MPFGKKVFLKIVGYAEHEYVQCFLVDILDDDVRRLNTNKYPHISISCNRQICGPVCRNDLLTNGSVVPTISNYDFRNTANYDDLYRNPKKVNGGGLIVEGMVGAFYRQPNGGVQFKRRQLEIQERQKKNKNEKKNTKKRKKKRSRKKRNSNEAVKESQNK